MIAYDPRIWDKTGHDIGNNDHCRQPATITKVYPGGAGYGMLVDLLFDWSPEESHGHFADGPCCAISGRIDTQSTTGKDLTNG